MEDEDSIERMRRDLQRSAEIGKSLLAENEELQRQMEAMRRCYTDQIEELEQEKHSLSTRLACAVHMDAAYREEIDNLRDTLQRNRAVADRDAESKYSAEIARLQVKLSESQGRVKDLEAAQHTAADERAMLDARISSLEREKQALEERYAADTTLGRTTAEADDGDRLHGELADAAACKSRLEQEVEQWACRAQAAEASAQRQTQRCAALQSDLEDAQCQAASANKAIEELRIENQELHMELDMVKIVNQDHKLKGNSVFAELEDKRLEAEKRLVSLMIENKSLGTQCDQYQQQLRNVKAQMAGILQTCSGSVDGEHMRRLEQQLAMATSRIEELTHAVQQYEIRAADETTRRLEAAVSQTAQPDGKSVMAAPTKSTGPRAEAVVDLGYAQALLKSKDTQIDKLLAELQAKRYDLLTENSRLQESQRRLRESDILVAKLRADNMQLSVRLEDVMAAAHSAAAVTSIVPPDAGGSKMDVAGADSKALKRPCIPSSSKGTIELQPADCESNKRARQVSSRSLLGNATAESASSCMRDEACVPGGSRASESCIGQSSADRHSSTGVLTHQHSLSSDNVTSQNPKLAVPTNSRTAARMASALQTRNVCSSDNMPVCLARKLTARASATAGGSSAAVTALCPGVNKESAALRPQEIGAPARLAQNSCSTLSQQQRHEEDSSSGGGGQDNCQTQ